MSTSEIAVSAATAEAHQAVETVVDAAVAEAVSIENAIVADAVARADHAQEVATEIVDAALKTEIVREVRETERSVEAWQEGVHARLSGLENNVQSLTDQLAQLTGQISALATLEIAGQNSSIPQQSEGLASIADNPVQTLEEVIPETLAEAAVVASPEPVARKRGKVFL